MNSTAPIVLLVGIALAALTDRAAGEAPPEPIRSLYQYLEESLPDGWEMEFLGEKPGTEKWSAHLRFAFEITRIEKIKLIEAWPSAPRAPEPSERQYRWIVYPEAEPKEGFGWHAFKFGGKHFSLRDPHAGGGSYQLLGTPEERKKIAAELAHVRQLIMESSEGRREAAERAKPE